MNLMLLQRQEKEKRIMRPSDLDSMTFSRSILTIFLSSDEIFIYELPITFHPNIISRLNSIVIVILSEGGMRKKNLSQTVSNE